MRTLLYMAIAATLTGCQQAPIRPSTASLPFGATATNQCVKAKCERKGDDLYVTIQQPATAVAGVQSVGVPAAGVAAAPLGGMQYQVVPGRTYRALGVDWARLPLPYLRMHSIPTGPQIAAVPAGGFPGIAGYPGVSGYPGVAGYAAPYGMYPQAAMAGYPAMAGVMPTGYAAGATQNAQLAALMQELKAAQSEAAADDTEAARAKELEDKAKALENKVEQLIKALDGKTSQNTPQTHSWGTNEGVPAVPGNSPIEQTSGSRFSPSRNIHESVEMWQHSPQNSNRNR